MDDVVLEVVDDVDVVGITVVVEVVLEPSMGAAVVLIGYKLYRRILRSKWCIVKF